jgi:hypothetical protein
VGGEGAIEVVAVELEGEGCITEKADFRRDGAF